MNAKPPRPWDRPANSTIPNRTGDLVLDPIYVALGKAVSTWEGVNAATAAMHYVMLDDDRSELDDEAVKAFGSVSNVHERAKHLKERWERFFAADFGASRDEAADIQTKLPKLMHAYRGWAERRNDLAHGYVTEAHSPDYTDPDQPIVANYALCPSHARTEKWPHVEPEYNYVASEIEAFADEFAKLDQQIEAVAERIENLRVSRTITASEPSSLTTTVWGRRSAFNVQKVLWLLDELSIPYDHVSAGGDDGGIDAPDFLVVNPHGRVPVVRDEAATVWESHTILRYLAAKHGGAALWSRDLAQRSQWDRWMDWSQTEWQPAFMGLFWSYYRTPEVERDAGTIEHYVSACTACIGKLERALTERPYLAGDTFSLADIPAGAALYRYYELDTDRPAAPNVEAWYARLRQRPAFRKNVMRSFDELKGKLLF